MRESLHCRAFAVLAAAVSVCALIAHAPAAGADPYTPIQTQDSAEFAIADGYIVKQMRLHPRIAPCVRVSDLGSTGIHS